MFASGKVPAGGFFVVGDADPTALPDWEGYSYGGSLDLPNTGGLIGLRCGPTTIDEAKYEAASPSGTARIFSGDLSPDAAANDDPNNWCDAKTEFATNFFGSPGTTNAICARAGSCRDPITGTPRAVVTPTADDLVITEVMGNPRRHRLRQGVARAARGERLRPQRAASLVNNSGTKGAIDVPADGSCVHVAAGTYALLANGADAATNGGLPAVTATFSAPAMVTGTSVNVSLQTATGAIIDQATYAASGEGPSAQLDPANLASQLNDVTSVWCPGTSAYGTEGNKGTPGAANVPCPGGNTGGTTCTDGNGSRAIITPAVGDLVISEWMADPNAVTDANGEWVEVYALKAVDLNGVYVKSGTTKGPVVSDAACVHLDVGQYAVFAKQTDPAVNGGIANARSLGSVALTNTTGRHLGASSAPPSSTASPTRARPTGVSTQLSSSKLLARAAAPGGRLLRRDLDLRRRRRQGHPGRRERRGLPVSRALVLLGALAGLLGAGCGSPCGPSRGTVATVVDGDTVKLESGETVRYLMVDTPEVTSGKNECWGARGEDLQHSARARPRDRAHLRPAVHRPLRPAARVREGRRRRGEHHPGRARLRVRALHRAERHAPRRGVHRARGPGARGPRRGCGAAARCRHARSSGWRRPGDRLEARPPMSPDVPPPAPVPSPRSVAPARCDRRGASRSLLLGAGWVALHVLLNSEPVRAQLRQRLQGALGERAKLVRLGPTLRVDWLGRVTFGPVWVGEEKGKGAVVEVGLVRVRPSYRALLEGEARPATVKLEDVTVDLSGRAERLRSLVSKLRAKKRPAATSSGPTRDGFVRVFANDVQLKFSASSYGPIDGELSLWRSDEGVRARGGVELPGAAEGKADGRWGEAGGHLEASLEDFDAEGLPAWVRDRLPVTWNEGAVSATFTADAGPGAKTATAALDVQGRALVFGGERLAPEPVGPWATSARLAAKWDGTRRRLELTEGKLRFGASLSFEVGLAASLSASPDPRFTLQALVDQQSYEQLLEAVPPQLRPGSDAPKATGTLSAHCKLDGPVRRPWEWNVNLRLDLAKLEAKEPLFLQRPFAYRPNDEQGKPKEIWVGDKNPNFVPVAELPNHVIRAVTTSEDAGFFAHQGFDLFELRDSVISAAAQKRVRGASTITQQLAKNLFLSREKTYARKVNEALITLALEASLSKARLLEIYLNIIEWGPGIHGIGEAARYYFGVDARALTVKQAAFLATIIPNPIRYHMYFARGSLTENWTKRVDELLVKMHDNGVITTEELIEAQATPLQFRPEG